MTELKRIMLGQDDLNYVQRLTYEVEGRQRIITRLLEDHAVDDDDRVLTSAAFKTYHGQLDELTAEFELAKMTLANKYLPPEWRNDTTAQWQVDFASGEMVIFR